MTMPVNMILVMYVILCILSYDFNKLTMLYIHVHISISMTNKSGLTFFLSIKYLSVCLSGTVFGSLCFFVCLSVRPSDYLKSNERDIFARGVPDYILGTFQITIRSQSGSIPERTDLHANFTEVYLGSRTNT